jgi:hypothetical protein
MSAAILFHRRFARLLPGNPGGVMLPDDRYRFSGGNQGCVRLLSLISIFESNQG